MFPRKKKSKIGTKGFLFFSICLFLWAWSVPSIAAEKINLGMVDSSASKMSKRFTPLMKYLKTKGVPAGKVVTAKNLDRIALLFQQGKIDLFFESPYGAVLMMDKAGAIPILIREKSGVREYNSVIFVRKNSPIQKLSDLKGKVISFEDKSSTSSFLLPKSILENAGLTLIASRKAVPRKLAYYFSKDDSNTIAQVSAGKRAHAGGIKKSGVAGDAKFRILSPESAFVPRHVVLVRKGVDYKRIQKVLLEMKVDPAAASALKAAKTPTGFSEFNGDPQQEMQKVKKSLGL